MFSAAASTEETTVSAEGTPAVVLSVDNITPVTVALEDITVLNITNKDMEVADDSNEAGSVSLAQDLFLSSSDQSSPTLPHVNCIDLALYTNRV